MRPVTRIPRPARAGWTLIEMVLASVLATAVMAKGVFVLSSALSVAGRQTASMHYEDQARLVVDRIALAVMGSDRGSLFPEIEEIHSDRIRYTFSLGLENGAVVWSDPEEIRLDGTAVAWRENPGAAEERRVTWTSLVSPLLEGEEVNGIDDNGNGLVDEDGLSFVLDGDRVIIRLTLRRPEIAGGTVEETVESIVTCRN